MPSLTTEFESILIEARIVSKCISCFMPVGKKEPAALYGLQIRARPRWREDALSLALLLPNQGQHFFNVIGGALAGEVATDIGGGPIVLGFHAPHKRRHGGHRFLSFRLVRIK